MKFATKKIPFFQSSTIQLFVIIFTIIYLVAFLFWQTEHMPAIDQIPEPLQIPAKVAAQASQVEVGLYVNNFPQFSFERGTFVLDSVIWFKFQSGTESLKIIEGFTIANALQDNAGKLIFLSKPIIKLIDNYVIVSYIAQTTFTMTANHKNFPIGNHKLAVIVQQKQTTPYELNFVSKQENVVINKENLEISWDPVGVEVQTGYLKAPLTQPEETDMSVSYPVAEFIIDFQNTGIRDLTSLYFPLLLLFFIILFCLLLDITDTSRLSYVATAVPILVLFRVVIDAVSPTVGYNTHIDYFFYLLVILSMIILLFQTYVVLTLHQNKNEPAEIQQKTTARLDYLNSLVLMGVLIALVVLTTLSHWR